MDISLNYNKEYYKNNKDKGTSEERLEKNRIWRLNNIPNTICTSARKRAKLYNLEFNLIPDDIIVPKFCPVLGLVLLPNQNNGKSGSNASPTLDRIDSSKGYTKDNVWVISNLANRMKSNSTKDELKLFANWINAND